MSSINPINVNTQGIGARVGFGAPSKEEKKAEEKAAEKKAAEQSPIAADKVLDYMAASAVAVTPAKTKSIDPSKYVDKASEERIAAFMEQFEEKVASGLKAFDKEFAGTKVSEEAKMAVVLKQVEKEIS